MKNRLLYVFVLLGILDTMPAFAQVGFVPSSAFRLNAGVDAGLSLMHGDLPNKILSPVGRIAVDYRIKEFITVGAEIQGGSLSSGIKGGARVPDERANGFSRNLSWGLYSKNVYQAIHVNAKVFVGQFNEENTEGASYYLNNIYLGLGVGYIRNSMSEIIKVFPKNDAPVPGVVESSSGIVIPVNIGVNIPFGVFSGNLNYQLNLSTSDGLDGYDMEGLSTSKDAFSLFTVGIRYNFGPLL